jgi:hypothetical protein
VHNGVSCQTCYGQRKKLNGCEVDVAPFRIEGYELTRCPLVHVTGGETDSMQAYLEYKNGFLPNDGGWLNQPMKFAQMINTIDKAIARMEKDDNA